LESGRLGLVFEEKHEDIVELAKTCAPLLVDVPNHRIGDALTSQPHFIIEGDNYLSLQILNYTHQNAMDLIYIDPPYNTGARDWKYNNDYVDQDDAYRHSKWLSFMNHRLRVAKSLLKESGFIVCAIDHYELFTLGALMDKIFGENNRVGIVSVVHKPEGRNQEKFFGTSNEFMLVYAGNIQKAEFNKIAIDDEVADSFDQEDAYGRYRLKNFIRLSDGKYSLRASKPHFFYPIYVSPDLDNISLEARSGYREVLPITVTGVERTWKTTQNTFETLVKAGNIVAQENDGRLELFEKLRENQVIKTHWINEKYHAYHHGTKVLEDILGNSKQFDFPKSIHLMLDVLRLMTKKDAKILDFFAGSGTTGHATLMVNALDGGSRQFILCTNNEDNSQAGGGIAETVCYPRIRNVISGYKKRNGESVAGLPASVVYYKTELVDVNSVSRISDEKRIELSSKLGYMIGMRESCFVEIERNEWWQVLGGADRTTAIYFREDKSELPALLEMLESSDKPVALYLFGWGRNEGQSDYSSTNVRVEDIPEPVLAVYRELNGLS